MKLLVEKDHELPLTRFGWLIPSGAASDPRDQEGWANFALEIFRREGRHRDREAIARYLAQKSSQLNIQITSEHAQISALVPSRDLKDFVCRLQETLQDAWASETEVNKLRQELLKGFSVSLENPATRAAVLWRRLLFDQDPWGNLMTGSSGALQKVTTEDLFQKRQQMLKIPGILVLGGDLVQQEAHELKQSLNQAFEFSCQSLSDSDLFSQNNKNRLGLWHDPHLKQASVILGWTGPAWPTKQWAALKMAEKILCSDYSSYLCQDFRQKAGLTYGIYGATELSQRGSLFRLRYSTSSEFGPQFLKDLLGALNTFQNAQGPYSFQTQDGTTLIRDLHLEGKDFEACKRKMINSLPFRYHTTQARLARQLEELLYGIQVSDREKYRQTLLSLTASDVRQSAQDFFSFSGLSVAIVDNMKKNRQAYCDLQHWDEVVSDGQQYSRL